MGRPTGHRHHRRRGGAGDRPPGTGLERPVVRGEPQAAEPALGGDHLVGSAVVLRHPGERPDRMLPADPRRPADVLAVHDRLAEHRHDREGRLGPARDGAPEPLQRLGRRGAQLLGRPHGRLGVEVEPAADHAGRPAHGAEAGPAVRRAGTSRTASPVHSDGAAHCSSARSARSAAGAVRSSRISGQSPPRCRAAAPGSVAPLMGSFRRVLPSRAAGGREARAPTAPVTDRTAAALRIHRRRRAFPGSPPRGRGRSRRPGPGKPRCVIRPAVQESDRAAKKSAMRPHSPPCTGEAAP
ncbi:hypothetical protein HDA36_000622 [Nocardiopsis composta]|uniref:Uncharacterized protein n=1 Tax=Nocardiopsis composta TaxID=157465 RepID=A0A7W8VC34_9ACTN|nr:hypothetical protein [Nocardiopsis composta]